MKKNILFIISVALCALAFVSCDETTGDIGTSLIDNVDNLNVKADTFEVTSSTMIADSVIARNITGYLGRIKDPETNAYVTSDFMVQLHTLANYQITSKDSVVSKNSQGEVYADSCDIVLYYSDLFGDSLQQMTLTAYELDHPLEEGSVVYSTFDPYTEGYVRKDGLKQNRTYTLVDYTTPDSTRKLDTYSPCIRVRLKSNYTDKDGKTYNNFGTYLLQKYYEDPNLYRDNYRFLHEVNPGFFFKITNGVGSMAYVSSAQLNVYFRILSNGVESKASTTLASTEEVLQTTTFSNDNNRLKQLAENTECTYLKTPAGLFTEVTLPVEEIFNGHDHDSLNTAKMMIPCLNNTQTSDYLLPPPSEVLILPKSELKTFFANNQLPDYKRSFLASYSSKNNAYTFNNISGLVNWMMQQRRSGNAGADWNKAVLVPVTVGTATLSSSSSSSVITKCTNDMSLSSTRLVGGANNPNAPIKISVIYSKFNGR